MVADLLLATRGGEMHRVERRLGRSRAWRLKVRAPRAPLAPSGRKKFAHASPDGGPRLPTQRETGGPSCPPPSPFAPPEVWTLILARAGPLRACPLVGASARFAAACRIQAAARASLITRHLLVPGVQVRVRYNTYDRWLPGRVIAIACSDVLGVEIDTGGANRRYFFLPSAHLRVRVVR